MNYLRFLMAATVVAALAAPWASIPARSESQGVIAVVNDQAITDRDLAQRIALLKIMGDIPPQGMTKHQALKSLIDDQVKIAEATRLKMMPSDSEVAAYVTKISGGMKLSAGGLLSKLKSQGISEASFRRYVGALIGFNRIISSKYRGDMAATPQEIDAKMAEIKGKVNEEMSRIMADPRMKGVTVYSLMEISLPVEDNDPMLLQARAVEAAQVAQRFKGCGSAKAAAEGVFNVKIGKKFDADAAKLPQPMRAALDKVGQGRAVGPVRGKGSIQLIAFCGSRKITPPKPDFRMPTREQIERAVINDKYSGLEEKYLSTIRDKVYVEYRDQSYAQQ